MQPVGTRRALTVTVAVLAAAIVVRSTLVPSWADFWFNVALIGVLVGLARWASLTRDELGLAPDSIPGGLLAGAVAFAAVSVVIGVGAALPFTVRFFDDERASIGATEMLVKVMVVIPLGTVLLEEFAFRGVVLGLARRMLSPVRAFAAAALAFGCWHIVTAWNSYGQNAALTDASTSTPGRIGSVVGTVVATSLAGAAFGWLRLRYRSLLVPIGAHLATNSVAFTAAWLLTR